ncbi:TerB N-terminal domain-containing protein [Methanococcoides methylutens]|uniref:TerB N-terminal domain-containing protein n=1 Tax=Methanococcoides methylutens MM1 TaxID=1434104 RepID=A0A0E3SRI1_METMT|nr:TerB N-terminal domain-containing protein [Methanococcoides methylutens]AKB84792.1 hypothetical protein MCMEM_0739 [Methanococcoides methylutens MM1]
MGFFDFLKGKKENKSLETVDKHINDVKSKSNSNTNKIVPYFDQLASADNVFSLLWFKDGKYKNYKPQKNTSFETEFFTIEFSFGEEPSLLSSGLPINSNEKINPNESIGYYPSYESMTPGQRWVYLNWLRDITQPVDIGYVFVFYYGLERHIIYGNFKKAADTIMLLRKYHKNNSFQSYSLSSLVISAIAHKDEATLSRVIESAKGENVNNDLLIAKYILKIDLSADEIISLSNAVGFKNKRYIKNYPELFIEILNEQLINEFEKSSFPFYSLDVSFGKEKSIIFANISLPENARYAPLPSIINNSEFQTAIHTLLTTTHNVVKERLKEMRSKGNAPTPKQSPSANSEESSTAVCPYCEVTLDKTPKKKKKCPHCGNFIYVRSSQVLYPSKHLTHDEAIATDEFFYLREYGITINSFNDKLKQLTKTSDERVSPIAVCIALYEDLILQTTDTFKLQMFYLRNAFIKYQSGLRFFEDL